MSSSAEFPKSRGCLLESLPPELGLKILLSISDLQSLQALVFASPIAHAQYRNNREHVLRACLHRDLGIVLPDAIGTLMSKPSKIGSPRTNEKIEEFLSNYRICLSDDPKRRRLPNLSMASIGWLVRFHLFVAIPICQEFIDWAMLNMSNILADSAPKREVTAISLTLSETEQVRIFRAIYRHQTYQHLFGANTAKRQGEYYYEEVERLFVKIFPPWDIEAMTSFDYYLRDFFLGVFDEVQEDLSDHNPKYLDPSGPDPTLAIDLAIDHATYLDGIMSRGLKIMMKFYRVRNNHDQLVSKAERCLIRLRGHDPSYREVAATVDYTDEDIAPLNLDTDCSSPETASMGWILAWHSISPITYKGDIPADFRKWAYTIWDEKRWDGFNAVAAMHKQWEAKNEEIEALDRWLLAEQERRQQQQEQETSNDEIGLFP